MTPHIVNVEECGVCHGDKSPATWCHDSEVGEYAVCADCLCSQCKTAIEYDPHSGYGMCASCLHDALRSGWTPGDES